MLACVIFIFIWTSPLTVSYVCNSSQIEDEHGMDRGEVAASQFFLLEREKKNALTPFGTEETT